MIDTPKKRGRPPGSKNKTPAQRAIELTGIPYLEPPRAEIESWSMNQGTKIVFLFRPAFGVPAETRETFLPPGWPVPQLNDTVRVGGQAGRVQYVEYDYEQGAIKVTCT